MHNKSKNYTETRGGPFRGNRGAPLQERARTRPQENWPSEDNEYDEDMYDRNLGQSFHPREFDADQDENEYDERDEYGAGYRNRRYEEPDEQNDERYASEDELPEHDLDSDYDYEDDQNQADTRYSQPDDSRRLNVQRRSERGERYERPSNNYPSQSTSGRRFRNSDKYY